MIRRLLSQICNNRIYHSLVQEQQQHKDQYQQQYTLFFILLPHQ